LKNRKELDERPKESKYSRDNPPPFTQEEIKIGLQTGKLMDDEGNVYLIFPTPREGKVHAQTEFYNAELRISVPAFRRERKPIDPQAKYKFGG